MTGMVVVCTGRHTHPRTECQLRMFRVPALYPREFQPFKLATADIGSVMGSHVRRVEAQCPVCGLGPKKIGRGKLAAIAAAGLTEIDISALPF